MSIIKSGATSDQLTIDPISKALRNTPYDLNGNKLVGLATFLASVAPTATTAGTAGVIANIIGSASKTIRVYRIFVLGTIATTAAECRLNLAKRVTTNATVGTSAAITPIALDSTDVATATANYWSVVGTVGTGGGVLETRGALLPLVASATLAPGTFAFDCPQLYTGETKPWILRGITQSLEVTQVTAPANVPTFAVSILFSEDAS